MAVEMNSFAAGIAARILAGLGLVAVAVAAGHLWGGAPGGHDSTGTVTIVASWTGDKPGGEQYDFTQVLKPFEDRTGIKVIYTGTRALDQLIQSDIQQGSPPDLAILPSPASLLYYQQLGYLHPLNKVISRQRLAGYDAQWLNMIKLGTRLPYTLPVKANLHNLIWYDPRRWPGVSLPGHRWAPSWGELLALEKRHSGTPWCFGLDSTPVSGWPATGWIADIMLHQSGASAYQQWVNGALSWTSPQVEAAWKAWGSLVAGPGQVRGGSIAALVTGWDTAGKPMFARSPGCYLQHQASFITVQYQQYAGHLQPGRDYDFFPSPMSGLPSQTSRGAGDSWVVSADLLGMFNDTPAARMLVSYLAGEGAQQIWPAIAGGGATSADRKVPIGVYHDRVDRDIARLVTNPDVTLCFNAEDLMPAALNTAFNQAAMEYLRNPGQLAAILARLEQLRNTAYDVFPQGRPRFMCGSHQTVRDRATKEGRP